MMLALLLLAVGIAVWWWWPLKLPGLTAGDDLPALCGTQTFEGVDYIVCEVDLRTMNIGIHDRGPDGKAFGSLKNFDAAMAAQGKPVLLAMNAGMYHEDLSPVGLLVEDGRTCHRSQPADGAGNFFLKPNGIFMVGRDGSAAIMETSAYAGGKA